MTKVAISAVSDFCGLAKSGSRLALYTLCVMNKVLIMILIRVAKTFLCSYLIVYTCMLIKNGYKVLAIEAIVRCACMFNHHQPSK